ncbi:MAG: hypothetical protein C0490_20435, partial [Marivirga sp.]|nr:hypothetical protein [Marivirga sp.]
MSMRSRIFLFVILLTISLVAHGQSVELSGFGRIEVDGQLAYLRDAGQNLTFEEVREKSFSHPDSKYSPNIGFDRSAHWFKMEITNRLEATDWLMEVAYAPLDQIDFYVIDSTDKLVHKTSGDHYPILTRDLLHRHPIFAFKIRNGESKTVYVRVQSISSVQVPITFWTREAFLKTSYKVQLMNGLFYGAMLVMILYQSFLFLSIRDKITFYYVLTLLTMVNVVAFFQGYSFLYVYPNYPGFNDILALVTG